MALKELLFFRAKAEMEAYQSMTEGYTEEEKELQRQRFCSVYQIIEEAELEDEYEEWRQDN